MRGSEELIDVDPGAAASPGEAGPLAESPLASAGPAVRNNTAEIARPGDALSPSQRHIDASSSLGALTNVRINVVDAEAVMSAPGMVEVVGQIAGRGVRRAGVYVDGRLARPIAISASGYQHLQPDFSDAGGQRGDDSRVRQRQRFRGSVGGRGRWRRGDDGVSQSSDVPAVRSLPGVSAVLRRPIHTPTPIRMRRATIRTRRNPYPYGYPPPSGTPPREYPVVQQTAPLVF